MQVPPGIGKRALVTGGAKRIGREIALTLSRAGFAIAVAYRQSAREAAELCERIGSDGGHAFPVQCDVTEERSVEDAVSQTLAQLGGLDLLVNNAGMFEEKRLETLAAAEWDRMFATNTRGPFLVARAALPALRQSNGRIVNVGSLGGMRAWPTHGHYCASKAALHMLTEVMAKAWAPEISVNTVAPGMIAMDKKDKAHEALARKTPMGRSGTAKEVAEAVLFFATGPAFITGQLLAVDGGLGL